MFFRFNARRFAPMVVLASTALFLAACEGDGGTADTRAVDESDQVAADDHSGEADDHDEAPEDAGGAVEVENPGALQPLPDVPDSLDDLPEGVNVVRYEMQLLTGAMQNILRLIADDRLDEISGQIGQVHPAYELTHQALEAGEYAPPANPDRIDEFVEYDEAFHDDLRALLQAAGDDDLEAATGKYSDLVEGCTNCHGEFRFP